MKRIAIALTIFYNYVAPITFIKSDGKQYTYDTNDAAIQPIIKSRAIAVILAIVPNESYIEQEPIPLYHVDSQTLCDIVKNHHNTEAIKNLGINVLDEFYKNQLLASPLLHSTQEYGPDRVLKQLLLTYTLASTTPPERRTALQHTTLFAELPEPAKKFILQ